MRIQPLFGGSAFARAGQSIQTKQSTHPALLISQQQNSVSRSADTTHFGALQKATGNKTEVDEYKKNAPGAKYLAQTHKAGTRGGNTAFPLKGFYVSSKKPDNVWTATDAEKEKLDAALKKGDEEFEKVFAELKRKKKYGF